MPSADRDRVCDCAYTTMKLEKPSGFVDDDGSYYERCEVGVTGAHSSATALRKEIVILRCDCFFTSGKNTTERGRREGECESETRPVIKESRVKQG